MQQQATVLKNNQMDILKAEAEMTRLKGVQEQLAKDSLDNFRNSFNVESLIGKKYFSARPGKRDPLFEGHDVIKPDSGMFMDSLGRKKFAYYLDFIEVADFETLRNIVGYYDDDVNIIPNNENSLYLIVANLNDSDLGFSDNEESVKNFYLYYVIPLENE